MPKFYTNVQMYGNDILLRGFENGERFTTREKFNPTLYVSTKKPTKWVTLGGEKVTPIKPGTIKETREYFEQYKNVDGFNVYGNERFIFQFISDNYPGKIDFDVNKLRILTIDIEVESERGFPIPESADEEILLITVQEYQSKQIITWGQTKHGNYVNKQDNVIFIPCDDEFSLLGKFLEWWSSDYPDVITGWNSEYYDIPYLCNRVSRLMGEKALRQFSPWNLVRKEDHFIQGQSKLVYDIAGMNQLDYLNLYKKFTYTNQESYRLDYIASVELGQKKLDHSEFDTFRDFYSKGWQKFVEYNIVDVELVDRMEDKMKLIDLAITMAYEAKVNYNDVFYQVRMWDTIIYNYLRDKNVVIPPKVPVDKSEKFAGAYVKEPKPGKYDYVVSFDLNSLYPHLIMQYAISPETLVTIGDLTGEIDMLENDVSRDQDRYETLIEARKIAASIDVDKLLLEEIDLTPFTKLDLTIAANGAMYKRVQGVLPELMEKMYDERRLYKKKMLKSKQKLVDIESEMKRRGIL